MSKGSTSTTSIRKIDLLGVGVCIGLTAVAYLGLIDPAVQGHERYEEMQLQESDLTKQVRDLERQMAARRIDLGRTRDALEDERVELKPLSRLNQRLSRLTDLALATSLEVEEIRPAAVARQPEYSSVPIKLAGKGSYRDCAKFLHGVIEDLVDVGIASFELRSEGEAGLSTGRFVFNLVWYAEHDG